MHLYTRAYFYLAPLSTIILVPNPRPFVLAKIPIRGIKATLYSIYKQISEKTVGTQIENRYIYIYIDYRARKAGGFWHLLKTIGKRSLSPCSLLEIVFISRSQSALTKTKRNFYDLFHKVKHGLFLPSTPILFSFFFCHFPTDCTSLKQIAKCIIISAKQKYMQQITDT